MYNVLFIYNSVLITYKNEYDIVDDYIHCILLFIYIYTHHSFIIGLYYYKINDRILLR